MPSVFSSQGAAGQRGSVWYSGVGIPGSIFGSMTDDMYLDTSNGNTWDLDATLVWNLVGNIAGPVGPSYTLPNNVSIRHLIGSSPVATIAAGSAAGAGSSVAIAGTDLAGKATVGTGLSLLATGVMATITFNAAFTSAPYVQLQAANAAAAGILTNVFVSSTTSTFVINLGATTGVALNVSYQWNYQVIQ